MSEPFWIPREQVENLHHDMIECDGGSHGLRDAALLDSALARPQNQYTYGETDIFQLASSYAEAISRNHPFVDGNKRTALMTAMVFLNFNGYSLKTVVGHKHVEAVVELAQGKLSREDMAAYLREHSKIAGVDI